VWEVSEADECRLDVYEGCPTFYYKTEMEITVIAEKLRLSCTSCMRTDRWEFRAVPT